MNKLNVAIFKLITNAAGTFQNRVNDALRQYREEMNTARERATLLKDEQTYISSQQKLSAETAREAIRKAQRSFASDVERYAGQLEEQLQRHVSEPLDESFRAQLLTLQQFGLKPSRTQIQALLKANQGNAIGLAALAKVLSDVESEYRLTFRDAGAYEKDLKIIRSLMVDPITYSIDNQSIFAPAGENYHMEAVAVMSGEKMTFVREDGSVYQTGRSWDGISLLNARNAFDSNVEEIGSMADSWICDVSFAAAEAQNTADAAMDESGADPDQDEQHKSSTHIEDGSGEAEQIARELGREKARTSQMSPEARKAYVR